MIRNLLRTFTGVERDEVVPVLLMALYGFLGMTSYYLLKAPRNSIFVDRVGADNLAYVYMLTAVFVTLVVLVYSRYVDRIGERSLLLGTFAVLAGGSTLFWWVLLNDTSFWSSGAFYLWTKLYPLLLVSQFWLVGNLVFTTRQARRLFGAIGVGLILGGIAGSGAAGTLAPILGTEALALVSAGVVVICASICVALFPRMRRRGDASGRLLEELSGDAVRILFRSGHLRSIAAILALTILVGTLLDWQLNRAVELTIQDEDAMTRFWGLFYMVLNVASVTIQVFFTGLVLRRWGVGVAILTLPVGLLIATVGVLAAPVLAAVAVAKGAEGALRYSLDQSTREVLYLPVPTETKYKVKPLIDLAVYRGGTGLGGVVILVAVKWMGLGIREVAAIALLMIVAWILMAVRMRSEYVGSLADSIRRRVASLDSAFGSLSEARTVEIVGEELRSDDPVQRAFALDLVAQAGPGDAGALAGEVSRLLTDPDPGVRAKALEVVAGAPETASVGVVRACLEDDSAEIRRRAVGALCAVSDEPAELVIRNLLDSDRGDVRRAALEAVVRNEVPVDGSVVVGRSYLEERWREGEEVPVEVRVEMALAAGTLEDDPRAGDYLIPLIQDPEPRVSETALRSAGRVGRPELLDVLVGFLDRKTARTTAREALVEAGAAAVPVLMRALLEAADVKVRAEAAHVLGRIPDQEAVGALARIVESGAGSWRVELEVVRALDRLRHHHGDDLHFDARLALMAAQRQLEAAESYGAASRTLARHLRDGAGASSGDGSAARPGPGPADGLRFLLRSMTWARNRRREAVFRCLALAYPYGGVHRAYRTLTSGTEETRANAAEWLEHTVGRELFLRLQPVLEDADPVSIEAEAAAATESEGGEEDGTAGRSTFGPERKPDAGGLRGVIYGLWHDEDSAVRHAAMWVAARLGLDGVERRLEVHEEDGSSPELRKLAEVLRRQIRDGMAGPESLDPVERCLLLEQVDLLHHVSPTQLLDLARLSHEREVAVGVRLVRKGEPGPGLHVLIRGEVEIETPGEGSAVEAGQGRIFGSWALVHGGPSPVAARARQPCRILELRREDLLPVVSERAELAEDLLRGFARKVRGSTVA